MARKAALIFVLLCCALATALTAQIKLMPVGDSITWGKINNAPPPAGTQGYRKPLYEQLVGKSITFVGDSGAVNYQGHFTDNARIGWFLPDSSFDVTKALTKHKPDMVILHIGTNNIGKGFPVGDYATSGTLMYQLFNVVKKITDNSDVKNLLLCKVIPKFSSSGEEVETVSYNNAVEIMLNELSSLERSKITVIDMWTPFYANKNSYYNYDVDKIHPNQTGYAAMANVFYNYISRILNPSYVDEFNYDPLFPWSDWVATPGVQIVNKGENGGGAITFTTTGDDNWDNLALWKRSRNLTTVSMKMHSTASANDLYYLGLAVGMDTTATTLANGYLVWIHYTNRVMIRTIVNGSANAGTDVANWPINPLQPGDLLKIGYSQAPDANYFYISVNNGESLTLRDLHKFTGNGKSLYSGVAFRGSSGAAYNYPIDNFTVETQIKDVIPPGRIYDLQPFSMTNTSVTLTWTSPGNDGYVGKASSYDLRYSTNPINTESDFANSKIVFGISPPLDVGSSEIYTLSGLQSGTGYYFAIRAIDDWGNKGDLSDVVFAKTNTAGEVIESFDRPTAADGTIGSDWLIDPNEYRIEYDAGLKDGEFANYRTDGAWGSVAVYKGRTNPSIVKLVWGRNATSDGIGQGGMALMLNSASLTASGYLLWVRNPRKEIYLYNIDRGQVVPPPDGLIDLVPYTLRDETGTLRLPQRGDTLSVILDWTFAAGIKFDVFINGQPAADRPLFDQQKRYNTTIKYSGIMLGRLNKTNNITSFITSAEYAGPGQGGFSKVSGDRQSGTVGTALVDSLKVKVLDANKTPLPGIPVYFSIIEPATATVSAPPIVPDQLLIEAEWGILTGTYNLRNDDTGASGSGYIVAPAGGPESGTAVYKFYVDKDTTYYFWGRLISPDIWTSSLMFKVDNNEAWVWNSLKNRYSNDWQWDRVNDKDGPPKTLILRKGLHFITITKLHSNVKIDKLLLTYKSSFIPTGKNVVDQLYTDTNGMAKTKLTLGTKAGPNRVLARAFGMPDTLQFYATGLPGATASMVKSNDEQTGTARDTLALPLTVTLYDKYNNPTPNVVVNFAVTAGDGKVLSSKDTTDGNGKAFTRFVLGIQIADNKVQATYSGGTPQIFTARATSGLVKFVKPVKVSGLPRVPNHPGGFYIGQVCPDYLKVQVLDEKNQPVSNVGVTFQIAKGPGEVGKAQPKKTDAQGFVADTLKLLNVAGIARVIAKVGAVQDTVVKDSVFLKGTYLDYYGGTGQNAMANDTLEFRLKVKVTNTKNEAVAGHPVSFVTRGNGFHFLDGSDSLVVTTNISGIAQTNVRLGPVYGTYKDIVEAKSIDGFFALKPKTTNILPKFTITVKSRGASLIQVAGENQVGVVRGTLPIPLTVKMVDDAGRPVIEQPVDWTIKSGRGQFEGTLMPKQRVVTDGDGLSKVYYTLGDTAGINNNLVEAYASNGVKALYNTPIVFHLSAKSTAADSMIAVTSKVLSGTVGKTLTKQVQVKLIDIHGNPVSTADVKFSVTKGKGTLAGTADTVKTVSIDNAAGIASIAWTLGPVAGTVNNVLEATASNGLVPLKGSPVRFTASGIPDSVNRFKSRIDATNPVMATEKDTCWITVTLMDVFRNKVANKRVRLEVSGGDRNFKSDPTLPTDDKGRAKGYLQSLSAGEKKIRAIDIDDNIRLDTVVTVMFTPDGAYKMQTYSGTGQTGNAGTALRDSLVVKIMDKYDNPVRYGPVKFDIIGGGGRLVGPQTVYSDSNGLASARLILGLTPGENVVKVTSQALIGSPAFFSATGRQGVPVIMRSISGSGQKGPVGQDLINPFVSQIVDKDLNPVAGIDVKYTVSSGKGRIVTSQPVKTDEKGFASCIFRPDTIAGTTTFIDASNVSVFPISGSPQRFTATSVAGEAAKIRYVSGDKQSGYVGETVRYPLLVKVTDSYGNGVSGASVQFSVVSGEATIQNGSSVSIPSDASGMVSVFVKLGTKVGLIRIEAINPLLQGSPVAFTLSATTAQPVSIEKFRGDNQKGRIGQELVEPLRVRVLDAWNNGVPGISVYYAKDSGGGNIVDPQPVISDSNGIASVRFRAANTPGKSYVSAVGSDGKVVTFTIETVVNFNNPVLDKSLIADSYDVAEGSELIIPIVASDADNQSLTFQIADLFPLRGMLVQQQSSATAVFRWTPGYDQSGIYQITLRVTDGYGGADQDTVRIKVLNVDRPPERVSVIPAKDTTAVSGQRIKFSVNYRDPDGDVLHYLWKVDGVTKGSDLAVFQYTEDRFYNGRRTIDVFVNDGVATVSYRWTVTFIGASKVSMSAMAAKFDQNSMAVTLQWSTSHESYNLGFDVLRSPSEKGQYEKINANLIPSHTEGQYFFTDAGIQAGQRYYYKIVDLDALGNRNENGPLEVNIPKPDKFSLMQNYPNPFNPTTTIRYNIARKERVRLSVFNLIGQRVAVIVDHEREPGFYTVQWDGKDELGKQTATGIYLYRLESESQVQVLRMVKLQ